MIQVIPQTDQYVIVMYLLREFVRQIIAEKIRSKKPTYKWKGSQKFDLDYFKSLPNESLMSAYAMNFLEYVDQGTSRIVFVLTSRKVLKLAKTTKGIGQNEAEVSVYTDPATTDVVAKIHDADSSSRWIISDMVRPLTSEREFEQLTGTPWVEFEEDLMSVISSEARKTKGAKIREDASEFTKKVYQMAEKGKQKLKIGDLLELYHWGKTPDGKVVLLDSGFTEEVAEKHYPTFARQSLSSRKKTVHPGDEPGSTEDQKTVK